MRYAALMSDKLLRLNLGCGPIHIPGFVNVDNDPDEKPDLVADIRHLPYEDGVAEVVYTSHVLEHFEFDDPVLEEWHRVLCPGGAIVVIVPDLIATVLMRKRGDSGWGPNHANPVDLRYVNAVVYGGYLLGPPYDRPGQVHKQVFIFDMLVERLRPLFPDAREVNHCGISRCEFGECMVVGTKPMT